MKRHVLGLVLAGAACVLSLRASRSESGRFAQAWDVETRSRQDALTEYRLLKREIASRDVPRDAYDIQGNTNVPCFRPPADQVFHPHARIWDTDRDPLDVVLRRTQALAEDLGSVPAVSAKQADLAALAADAGRTSPADTDARYALFEKVVRLRRTIAFANPLVAGITNLLFVTREVPPPDETMWGTHMCDQYFGFHATLKGSTLGNGIWSLANPFTDKPVLTELMPRGRTIKSASPLWNGKTVTPEGGFLSPDVSYDGREIIFSWTPGEYRLRAWDDWTTFHIMKMKADGSALEMLTWGGVNDLFPCWLPSGRILFCSERRGGYGRCHMRETPNFTLHSMFPDGTDIVCLSPHETNEWEPSVDGDGMVVYTRWDYTDRGFNQAHHAWITYPDGRDPRELNGNLRTNERVAPHMEQNIRAIPGSRKYVAVAVGHHTPWVGSLVVIDPSIPDDGAMAQIKRLTPDALFPESEKMLRWPIRPSGTYGTPWPLSEKYYLCTYDGDANSQYGVKIDYQRRKYALTLLDAFGNKIRVYTHPSMSCMYPMPLQARPRPPVIPHKTLFGRPADANGVRPTPVAEKDLPQTADYGLINVYHSRRPFPAGVKIKALRIWKILPKVYPYDGHPRLGAVDHAPGRTCLGTVPVEEDGSAHFSVPVKTPVYFQALDENGCAVQTMRSVAYAQAGERLTCNGCHESRHGRTGAVPGRTPKAFTRVASSITPEVEGADPFNYPRLVQPVLDAKCISCHGEKRQRATMPDLRTGDIYLNRHCFHTSYLELIKRGEVQYYTRRYEGTNMWQRGVQSDRFVPPFSEPGKVGARASRLYARLAGGKHHGVSLTPEEMRRLIVFMDSQGTYLSHETDALAQCKGEVVHGCAFPDTGLGKIVCNAPLLVVGTGRMGACVARHFKRRPLAVVTETPLSDEVRAIYAKLTDVMIFEGVKIDEIVRGRKGFVKGVRFTDADGRTRQAQASVLFDATGTGRVCRETGAVMENGCFRPGREWCFPYLPDGSRNVLVADATAAVPPETATKLADPSVQDALGQDLGNEARQLSYALGALFDPLGY